MEIVLILALVVFIITYLLIAVNKTRWFELKRSDAALLGALAMILVGAIAIDDVWGSIDFKVLALLLGMMLLVAGLEHAGFFTLISDRLLRFSGSGWKLLLVVMFSSAFLSAIALNDAIVLMFTPIVIGCCRKMRVNPIPYLVGLMVSANIGSIATAVGNPQNVYIISHYDIDFTVYSAYCLPIAVMCLITAYLILLAIYRRSLLEPCELSEGKEESIPIKGSSLTTMIVILVATFIGFLLTSKYDIELYQVALVSGAMSAVVVIVSRPRDADWLIGRIDWNILLFFVGLFVLIGGASHSGLISEFSSHMPGFGEGETPDALTLSVFTVILSNLVSNVPAVMLITEMMPTSELMLCIVLAASSTLAGNTTLLGSAANIIVAERSEKYGVKIHFFRFMAVGVTVTIATVAVMLLFIQTAF